MAVKIAYTTNMTLVPVARLWKANKDLSWAVGEDLVNITLEDMLRVVKHPSFLDEIVKELLEEDKKAQDNLSPFDQDSFLAQMEIKIQAIQEYAHRLELYKDREQEIPDDLIIEVEDDNLRVEDGNHRLVAAKWIGLKKMKVRFI